MADHVGSTTGRRGNGHEDGGKHTRYTTEQLVILEKVYAQCEKPSLLRRQEMIHEFPILSNVEARQIKIWFQNRRCRDKLKKEASQLHSVNEKLTATNKLLAEENGRLQRQVRRLISENKYMRQQLRNVSGVNSDRKCERFANSSQHYSRDAENPTGLLLVAEETKREFLSKATGAAIDWVPLSGMKPGLDSAGSVAVSYNCVGVAARACNLISLEPNKILEILKDRSSWSQDCRNLEVFAKFPAGNGGTIELVYMQFYAPTTLTLGIDFWTLRYTSTLEDGSLVVCEKSMSGSGVGPSPSGASQYTRVNMLASGYLIRPCEGGGSIVHIVDHLDLQALCVPEVLRPLHESSELVAQKMTFAALRHIGKIAQETGSGGTKQPAVLRSFRHRLSRGFNDAINGFNEDGWSVMDCDAGGDLIICVNSTRNLCTISNPNSALSFSGGILCVKASMLLQDVSPALLVQFLRDHRSEWADLSIDARSAASLKAGSLALRTLQHSTQFSASTVRLGHTVDDEEILEMIRFEGHGLSREDAFLFQNISFLQVCNGLEKNAIGACSELIFAPIDETLSDDALLLSSGFRILKLDSNTFDWQDTSNTGESSSSDTSCSMLIIAFQFPFESHLQEDIATMARKYISNVIHSVQRFGKAISPSGLSPRVGLKSTPDSLEAVTLANWICQSYSSSLGADLLVPNLQGGGSVLEQLWHHQHAIVCCSFETLPVFLFANQSGLGMLETTLVALQDITLDQIFDGPAREALNSVIPVIMQQGFAILSSGTCMSVTGRCVFYEQAIAWRVLAEGGTLHSIAFAFINWSFV